MTMILDPIVIGTNGWESVRESETENYPFQVHFELFRSDSGRLDGDGGHGAFIQYFEGIPEKKTTDREILDCTLAVCVIEEIDE